MTALKKWEIGLRIAAYTCGAAGAVLAVRTRPGTSAPLPAIALLGAMVAAFLGANGLRIAAQIRSIHRPPLRRPSAAGGAEDNSKNEGCGRAPASDAQPPSGQSPNDP